MSKTEPKRELPEVPTSGGRQVLVRAGFSDYDGLRSGYACAATGNLDAPDLLPQGSTRVHNTMKLTPALSIGHREWDCPKRQLGSPHDGPEAVPGTLYLHKEPDLEGLKKTAGDEASADVTLSATVHKSKGGEWDTVRLGQDFEVPERFDRVSGEIEVLDDEVKLRHARP